MKAMCTKPFILKGDHCQIAPAASSNIISQSMENLTFHSLLRWKMINTTSSHHLPNYRDLHAIEWSAGWVTSWWSVGLWISLLCRGFVGAARGAGAWGREWKRALHTLSLRPPPRAPPQQSLCEGERMWMETKGFQYPRSGNRPPFEESTAIGMTEAS